MRALMGYGFLCCYVVEVCFVRDRVGLIRNENFASTSVFEDEQVLGRGIILPVTSDLSLCENFVGCI